MDGYTTKMLIAGGVLLGLLFLVVVWKFFFSFLKHVLIILILGSAFVGFYWYRMHSSPPKNSVIGKHAYLTASGKYLGVVEGEGEDARRGPVWNVRFPGGHPQMYGKSRVTLKDKRDIASESTPELTEIPTPTLTPKPGAEKKPGSKK
jgi:hypothetical protein